MGQNDESSAMVIYGYYENFYCFYENSDMVIYGFYENFYCWLFILVRPDSIMNQRQVYRMKISQSSGSQ